MRTDSLYYRLFSLYPASLLDLLGVPADVYRFESVEVKQTAFRIDGVFLPNPDDIARPIVFCEVQMQSDPNLYRRLFSEIFLYLHRVAPPHPWKAAVIFASRAIEPQDIQHYQHLLASGDVVRIFLDEISSESQPLGIAMLLLVAASQNRAQQMVREMVERSRREVASLLQQEEIIDLIATIAFYKFPSLSLEEVREMLGMNELRESRAIQEAIAEGREEGLERGILRGKLEAVPILHQQGLSIEAIANALSLSVEQVRQAIDS